MRSALSIESVENEELSSKTRKALLKIVCENGSDGRPFKLPNEADLSLQLGVSRNVLRDALMSLEEMGIVTRRRRRGTLANPQLARETGRMDSNPELKTMLEDMGFTVKTSTLRLGLEFDADPAFGLEGGTYLNVEKIFVSEEDDTPLAYCADHISGKFAKLAGDAIFSLEQLSHYEFLKRHCGTSLAYTVAHLDAIMPEPWLQDCMKIPSGEPVFFIDDFGYNFDHDIVVHSHIYYRHGCLDLKMLRKCW